MNRRIFIKTIGAATVMCPSIFALEDSDYNQQWIRYTDEMPKIGQNIVVLYFHPLYAWTPEVSYGKVSESISNGLSVDFDDVDINFNQKILDGGFKVVMGGNYIGVGFQDIQDSIYWIPFKNKLPRKIPKLDRYKEF